MTDRDLVLCHLRFAYGVALEYRDCGVPLDDLVQAASVGLVEAARRFDPARGVKFITYAVYRIRQAVIDEIRSQGLVRLPRHRLQAGERAHVDSLNLPASPGDPRSPERIDALPDGNAGPEGNAEEIDVVRRVGMALLRLSERDRFVLTLYFGLDGPEYTLAQIAAQMGLSRQRVCQIKDGALERLGACA